MLGKVWDDITYPFLNFNSATVEVWELITHFIPNFIMDVITYREIFSAIFYAFLSKSYIEYHP